MRSCRGQGQSRDQYFLCHSSTSGPSSGKRKSGPYLSEWGVGGVFQGPTVAVEQLPSILDGFGDSVPFTKEACWRENKVKSRGPEGFVPGAAHTFMLPAMSHLGTPDCGTLPAHRHTSLQDCQLQGAEGLGKKQHSQMCISAV